MKKRRKKPSSRLDADQGAYTCPTCGESIIIPLDLTQGTDQEYIEDCPVCCNPNIVHVELDPQWPDPRVWAERE